MIAYLNNVFPKIEGLKSNSILIYLAKMKSIKINRYQTRTINIKSRSLKKYPFHFKSDICRYTIT